MSEHRGHRRRAKVDAATVHSVIALLNYVMNAAIIDRRIAHNPVSTIGKANVLPRQRPRKAVILDTEQVLRLAASMGKVDKSRRYVTLVKVLAFGGLRIGEALALRVGDVDLMRRRIRVERALKEVSGKLHEGLPKTEDGARTVVLPASLSDELARHIEEFSDPSDPQAYVFGGPDGGPTRASNFRNRHFHPALARAGLPEMRPHDPRHSAATLLFEAGASPKEVQEALGHSDPRFTLRVYTAVLDAMRERTADRMDAKITGADTADEAKVIAFPG